ncbi:MAG: rRNA maturation RNase YbeY [Actinomycetota bacterium]
MADADHTPRVLVDDRQDSEVDADGLATLARSVLVGEGAGDAELSVSFVTEDEMAALHQTYTGEPGPTDVLSFALDEQDRDEDGVRILGDVVIAPAVAAANNPEDPAAELRLLVVHGILHLLGHDHHEDDDKSEMWTRQERYAGVRVP